MSASGVAVFDNVVMRELELGGRMSERPCGKPATEQIFWHDRKIAEDAYRRGQERAWERAAEVASRALYDSHPHYPGCTAAAKRIRALEPEPLPEE